MGASDRFGGTWSFISIDQSMKRLILGNKGYQLLMGTLSEMFRQQWKLLIGNKGEKLNFSRDQGNVLPRFSFPPLPGRPSYMLLCSKKKVRYLPLKEHCEGEEKEESTFDILITLKPFLTSDVCLSHSRQQKWSSRLLFVFL